MLLSVGGESRTIILGEVPPVLLDQEQDSAQDVAAQWMQSNIKENNVNKLIQGMKMPIEQGPVPQPRFKTIKLLSENKDSSRQSAAESEDSSKFFNMGTKKLIPVDFDLKLDEDEDNKVIQQNMYGEKQKNIAYNSVTKDDGFNETKSNPYLTQSWAATTGLTKQEYHRYCDTRLASYDLATQRPTQKVSSDKNVINQESLPCLVIEDHTLLAKSEHLIKSSKRNLLSTLENNIHHQEIDSKLPIKKKPVPKPRKTVPDDSNPTQIEENEKSVRSSMDELFFEDRLSLTLEEIVHIRSVLTKAELESLPVEGRVKEDVEKRRVCFLCLKTRFGLLGPWGQRCQLCKRTVCIKCFSKMRIPTAHFAHVPVMLLSPGLMISPSSADKDTEIFNGSWLRCRSTIVSAPTSPATKRCNSHLQNDSETTRKIPNKITGSLENCKFSCTNSEFLKNDECRDTFRDFASPVKVTHTFGTMGKFGTDRDNETECIRRTLAIVCHDCRLMLIQIIKNSRITRTNIRNNVISRLTLNLSPAYI